MHRLDTGSGFFLDMDDVKHFGFLSAFMMS